MLRLVIVDDDGIAHDVDTGDLRDYNLSKSMARQSIMADIRETLETLEE